MIARKLVRAPNAAMALNARNRDGDTILHACAKAGYTDAVQLLLQEGTPHLDIDAVTAGGFTALAYASRGGFLDIVIKLVTAGADPSVLDGEEARRFFPSTADRRQYILDAVRIGRAAYALQLRSVLLHSVPAPWDQTPEVLIDMLIDYLLAERSQSSVSSKPSRRQLEAEEAAMEEAEIAEAIAAVERLTVVPLDE